MDKIGTILSQFAGKNILIIGDVMLDKYIEGGVSRISPEAPVPVVRIEKEFFDLGGAANVASNVASLGGKAALFSFIGREPEAEILKILLRERGIEFYFDERFSTIRKTRVLGNDQQIVRMDREEAFDKAFDDRIKYMLIERAKQADFIVISDYAKGTITKDLMSLLSTFKSKMLVDPKPQNKNFYGGAYLITPNEKEALEMASCSTVDKAGDILRANLGSHVLVTRGEKGMVLFSDSIFEIPTCAKEVFDVSGAGDSVIAALSLALASGSSLEDAAIIANNAAGIAVERRGTYSVKIKELRDRIFSEEKKIVSLDELKAIIFDYKRKGKKVGWTNGCFDILHIGHVNYLKKASERADILIVGLNSDESVRKLKGPTRPIQSENERAEILASLKFIDHVLIFSEPSVEKYLVELQPNIYIKGGDYNIDSINQIERKIVEGYGGEIALISFVDGKSTTDIISRIKRDNNGN